MLKKKHLVEISYVALQEDGRKRSGIVPLQAQRETLFNEAFNVGLRVIVPLAAVPKSGDPVAVAVIVLADQFTLPTYCVSAAWQVISSSPGSPEKV